NGEEIGRHGLDNLSTKRTRRPEGRRACRSRDRVLSTTDYEWSFTQEGSVAHRRGDVASPAKVRVLLAVGEVHDQPEHQPDDEPDPRVVRQTNHERPTAQDAEKRHERHEWRLE